MAKQPVGIDDFCTYDYVNSVRVTPDGRALVYSVIRIDREGDRYLNDLWCMDLATRTQRRLTASGKEGAFDFLPDGRLIMASGRGEELGYLEEGAKGTNLWVMALDGGEAQLLAHLDLTVRDWRVLADGSLLVLARELRDAESEKAFVVLDDSPVWTNGDTYTAGNRWGLWLVQPDYQREGGALACEARRLTDESTAVELYAVSADATAEEGTVYAALNSWTTVMGLRNVVAAYDIATGTWTHLGMDGLSTSVLEVLDGDELMMLSSDLTLHGCNTDPQAYVLPTDGSGTARRISGEDFDCDLYNHIGSDARQGGGRTHLMAGGALLWCHAQPDTSAISRIDADGAVTRLVGGPGSVDSFDTLDGRELYYVAMRPGKLAEVYHRSVDPTDPATCELAWDQGGDEERLTDFSATIGEREVLPCTQVSFESNGAVITGYVMVPADYDPVRTYPGILWMHGGPKCQMGDMFFHELQWLAGLGYVVFWTNPHGSGGHGMDYAASIFGRFGTLDFQDLMAFTDHVLATYPNVDPARLAVMGGSYGGFMTNWVIGHTDRFACACSQRSISNWVSMWGTSDIGAFFAGDQTLAWPWDKRPAGALCGEGDVSAMWDQSPLKYADKVTTPTLFLHSDADYRCPLEQGLQMYTALQMYGVPTRLVVFKDENHELSRSGKPKNRLQRLEQIRGWCARFIGEDAERD